MFARVFLAVSSSTDSVSSESSAYKGVKSSSSGSAIVRILTTSFTLSVTSSGISPSTSRRSESKGYTL